VYDLLVYVHYFVDVGYIIGIIVTAVVLVVVVAGFIVIILKK